MVMVTQIRCLYFYVALISMSVGAPLSDEAKTDQPQRDTHTDQQSLINGARDLYELFSQAQKTADLISHSVSQLKEDLSAYLPHTVHKRQATQLTINSHSPPDSVASLGVSHTLGGGGGTSFGGQLGLTSGGEPTWGLNVGQNTGSSNFGANVGGAFGGGTSWGANADGSFGDGFNVGANVGGTFGGDTNWGANVGGSLGEGLEWSANAGGEFGGSTNWGLNLDQTWDHEGGASSSLGGWVNGGQEGPSAGIKYELNL